MAASTPRPRSIGPEGADGIGRPDIPLLLKEKEVVDLLGPLLRGDIGGVDDHIGVLERQSSRIRMADRTFIGILFRISSA